MLGEVNGVPVISAARVPWLHDDDPMVQLHCESRGLVLYDRGGKSDAVVVGGHAIIWERNGERFRAFEVDARPASGQLKDVAEQLRRIALRPELDQAASAVLFNVVGIINVAARGVLRDGL